VGDALVSAYFSPSDDALRVLRGQTRRQRLDEPDPSCNDAEANCQCRASGRAFVCDYCALDEAGFGLLETAEERILVSMYSATDMCFALGVTRARERGVQTLAIWDRVQGASPYQRDDFLCGAGVETLLSQWDEGSAQARNHNKIVVVDDAVFDGSMNISASGADVNNEGTLVIEEEHIAQLFAEYVEDEAILLRSLGADPRSPDDCRCADLIDNDGDGLIDDDDQDCDGGAP
jgi:phosphatidylserine/phosphatidylglycerophosphate/cardiolipin synthase-like enzyme